MTEPGDGNTLLMSGGTPWAKFPAPGARVEGTVRGKPESRQQLDFDTNRPFFWDNGDKKMEVVVMLDTGVADPSIEDDDGVRALHMRGKMLIAVRNAVKAIGATGLEDGGRLAVTYTTDVPSRSGKGLPSKDYAAQYTRPTTDGNAALMAGGAAPAGAVHPAVANLPPCPPGVPPEKWAAMLPDQRATVAAAVAAQQIPVPTGAPPY